jgi:Flp pilus assembly protein TadD
MRCVTFVLTVLIGLGLASVPLVIGPARAAISPGDEATLQEAADLLNHKQPTEALAKLGPLRPTLAGEVDFNVVYGIALLESDKPRQAETAFRRALTVQPENMLARAHLARALAANGELDDARREIMVLRDRTDLPPDVRAVMDNNLRRIDEARKQRAQAQVVAQAQAQAAAQAAGTPINDKDTALIRGAAELVKAEKSAEAYEQLAPMEGRLAGNPDFDYVYGVAALDSGHPAQAVVALRRALQVRPDFHTARAELGRALAAMGDLAGAKREFETVRNIPDLPPVARDALGRRVAAIDEAVANQNAKRYSGYLESSIGYDTNVNAGPSDSTLLIPALAFLGPATISPQAMPKQSAFYEIAGGFSGALPINNETAVFANLAGNIHPLFDSSEFQTAVAGGEAGVARQVQNLGIFSVAGVAQTFLLGGQTFRNIYGAAGQWRQRLAEVWDTSIALSWLRLAYPNLDCTPVPAGCQDTNRYTLTGTVARRFDTSMKPAVSLTANVGREVAITEGYDFFSYNFVGVRGGVEVSPLAWMLVFAQASYEDHRYEADYPLFLVHRHDQLFDVLGGVEFKITDTLSLRPSVHWSQTRSNVGIFSNQRWITQAALRRAF